MVHLNFPGARTRAKFFFAITVFVILLMKRGFNGIAHQRGGGES